MFSLLNFNSAKKLFFQISFRKLSTNFTPVRLAYASYESTAPPSEQDPAALVVNHGIFGSKSNWNSLCKVYHEKTRRKIIAVDARNHGDSPHAQEHTYVHLALDLEELVKQLKLTKVAVLGHSMGGRAAMYFALKYPNLVDKLIVVDISPVVRYADMKSIARLFNVLQSLELPKNVTMSVARNQTDQQLSRYVMDKGLRNFLLTNLVQTLDGSYHWRINISALKANFDDICGFPPTNSLNFQGPVLFMSGANSDLIQNSDHERILKLFPKAEFVSIEGTGHWLHSEKPKEFLDHTVKFLNKNDKL
ncbi:sn-1-specific diacylglycerol lipase ABHD11-like isoform X2 [Zophobas morio]|uniref:sn-1-specific diacylglycerol lipase ABHD11-like isoform X2 n=1 Tax=Zophobas morio TaxID=2755281 RepID=UPI00308390A5